MKNDQYDSTITLILATTLLIIGGVFGFYQVFFKAEISNPETQFLLNTYGLILLISMPIVIALFYAFKGIKKNDKYGDSMGFNGIGKNPSSKLLKNWTHTQLYLISLIIFGFIFLMANKFRLGSGTGQRLLPQQFSNLDSLIFATAQVPIAENMLLLASVSFIAIIITFMFLKYRKGSPNEYKAWIYILYSVGMGFLAWILHQSAYRGSDVAGYVVFFFWTILGLITIWTGSPMPGIAMHQMNNFMITYAILYSSDKAFNVMIGILGVLIALFIWIYGGRLFRGKKKEIVLK